MAPKQAHRDSAELESAPPLEAVFSWRTDTEDSGVGLSTGNLELTVDGDVVWPADSGFAWAWIELLDWLSLSWTHLIHEDGLPVRVDPAHVPHLRSHVDEESRDLPAAAATDLEVRVWEFLETHDLSRALQGAAPPAIVVWREGLIGHVLTEQSHLQCDWDDLHSSLVDVGESIKNRISPAEASDPVVTHALSRWRAREDASLEEVASAATGLDGDRLAPVLDFVARHQKKVATGTVGEQFFAAARMTSSQPTSVITEVMSLLASVKPGSTQLLDETSDAVCENARPLQGRPYEQGHLLGECLRKHLDLNNSKPFDPANWLIRVGVDFHVVELNASSIDALACWGAEAGPAVLVNRRGIHSRSIGGRNASIAHEICHLLIDRDGALPAVEVLGGRVNPSVEARARAFSAEVLLPRAYAGSILAQAVNEVEAEKLLRALSRSHKVSRELAAWQARNSDAPLNRDVWETLRRFIKSSPWQF